MQYSLLKAILKVTVQVTSPESLVYIYITILRHQPAPSCSHQWRDCKIQDPKAKTMNDNEYLYCMCAHPHTSVSTLFTSQWIPWISRLASREILLKGRLVSAQYPSSRGMASLQWFHWTPPTTSVSQRKEQTPPESSLESSDTGNKPLLCNCSHHTLSNLKTTRLLHLWCWVAQQRLSCRPVRLWNHEMCDRCVYEHVHIYGKSPSLEAKFDWNPHLSPSSLGQII